MECGHLNELAFLRPSHRSTEKVCCQHTQEYHGCLEKNSWNTLASFVDS